MQYTKEARFCFGMCLQLDENFEIKYDDPKRPLGMVLPAFDHTEQKIVPEEERQDAFKKKMERTQESKGVPSMGC